MGKPCPRCGSPNTSRAIRKKGTGKKAVETNVVDEWCDDCGWHGFHTRDGQPPDFGEEQPLFPEKKDGAE